jgi:hypothetical protein
MRRQCAWLVAITLLLVALAVLSVLEIGGIYAH